MVSCPAPCALIFTLGVLQFALGVWRFHTCTPCWAHAVGFRHFAPCIFALDALRFAMSCSGVLRLAVRLLVRVHTVHPRHVSRLGIGMVLLRFALLHLALGALLHTCSCKPVWWVLGALHLYINALVGRVALSAFTRRLASWCTSDWYSRGGRRAFRASRLVVDALHRVLLRSASCLWLCPFSSRVTQCTFGACRPLVLRC
jgi:hypothetical protein